MRQELAHESTSFVISHGVYVDYLAVLWRPSLEPGCHDDGKPCLKRQKTVKHGGVRNVVEDNKPRGMLVVTHESVQVKSRITCFKPANRQSTGF